MSRFSVGDEVICIQHMEVIGISPDHVNKVYVVTEDRPFLYGHYGGKDIYTIRVKSLKTKAGWSIPEDCLELVNKEPFTGQISFDIYV